LVLHNEEKAKKGLIDMMSEGRKVVENTLQLLILVLPEGILLEARFEEHEQQQQQSARA